MMQMRLPTPTSSTVGNAFSPSLTSTTAPGKLFASRSELQSHYKSDWHRYNLKRREAGLPMLNENDFTARLESAMALRKEKEQMQERSGVGHRKDKGAKKITKEKKQNKQRKNQNRRKPTFSKREEEKLSGNLGKEEENALQRGEKMADNHNMQDDNSESTISETMEVEEGPPEINPCQSLFDNNISSTPSSNLEYMQSKYSFYLPDSEYCIDLEGFLGYCNEKVRWGNVCLYCQKTFGSTEGLLKHMRDKRHCKVLYEPGVDQEEFDVFYDFSAANREFLGDAAKSKKVGYEDAFEEWMDIEDGEEGEWEHASMKDEEESEEDNLYRAYQSEMATHGFGITPLGELIFPDGRIVGHRGLARYYKQRFAPDRLERAAVRHAKEALGDRLYRGRVLNLDCLNDGREKSGGSDASTALVTMGGMAGSIPTGRDGRGILVAGEGKSRFTSLSLYRYHAVVKKQRRDDARGQRLEYRAKMNMNKMDKKGNRLVNGVVTALAPR